MRLKRLRTSGVLVLTAMLLVAACTAGDEDATDDTTSDSAATETTPSATGPSPGVTDDTIKVGVTYVDTASLVASGLNYDLGEHEAVYTALFDAINADGGINGRQIEPVFAPIDPTNPAPAEEKCVQLTEDEDVFMVIGFFLNDAVLCPVSLHATAVVGGAQNAETAAQAEAPWLTWLPDTDQPEAVTQAFAEAGELDGTVAVYGAERDQVTIDDTVLPVLDELGIEVVETGIMDAPADDPAAVQASVQTIAQSFEASGADTIVIVGASGQDWPTAMAENDSYRPKLLFLEQPGAAPSTRTRPRPTPRCWRARSSAAATAPTRPASRRRPCRSACRSPPTPGSRSPPPTRSATTTRPTSPTRRPSRPAPTST